MTALPSVQLKPTVVKGKVPVPPSAPPGIEQEWVAGVLLLLSTPPGQTRLPVETLVAQPAYCDGPSWKIQSPMRKAAEVHLPLVPGVPARVVGHGEVNMRGAGMTAAAMGRRD